MKPFKLTFLFKLKILLTCLSLATITLTMASVNKNTKTFAAINAKKSKSNVAIAIASKDKRTYFRIGDTAIINVRVTSAVNYYSPKNIISTINLPEGWDLLDYTVTIHIQRKTYIDKYYPNSSSTAPYNQTTGEWFIPEITYYSNAYAEISFTLQVKETGNLHITSSAKEIASSYEAKNDTFELERIQPFPQLDSTLYTTLGSSTAKLYKVNTSSKNYVHEVINASYTTTIGFNATAYNPKDNYIYGFRRMLGSITTQRGELWVIGAEGIPRFLRYFDTKKISHNLDYISATCDPDGILYITNGRATNTNFHQINLKTFEVKSFGTGDTGGLNDIAWKNDNLYGVSLKGDLIKLVPKDNYAMYNLGTVGKGTYKKNGKDLQFTLGYQNDPNRPSMGTPDSNVFGALYSGSEDGNFIYGSLNSGFGFIRIYVGETGIVGSRARVISSPIQSSMGNDGVHNVDTEIRIPTDLGIKITPLTCHNPGKSITYQVHVTNHYFSSTYDAKVDLRSWLANYGIPNANLSYTAITQNGAEVELNANGLVNVSIPMLSINDEIAGILFTVTVNIPASVTSDLNIEAEVILPPENKEINDEIYPNKASVTSTASIPFSGVARISNANACLLDTPPTLSSGGYTGTWLSTNTAIATVTPDGVITLVGTGTVGFRFTPTLLSACVPDEVKMTVNTAPAPPVSVSTDPTCAVPGGIVEITSPVEPGLLYRLHKTDGVGASYDITQASTIFKNLQTGTYSLTSLYNGIDCQSNPPQVIVINPLSDQPTTPLVTAINPTCNQPNGGSLTANIVPPGFSYALYKLEAGAEVRLNNDDITANVFNNLSEGLYHLYLLSATLCPSSPAVINLYTESPVADAGPDFSIDCITNPSDIIIGTTAIANHTYRWTSKGENLEVGNTATITVLPATTTTYKLEVTNNTTGCAFSDEVTIIVNKPLIIADAGNNKLISCLTNPDGVTIGTTAIAGYSYYWQAALGLSATDQHIAMPKVSPSVTTTYFLTVTDSATGCSSESEVIVEVDNILPPLSAGNDFAITCIENSAGGYIGFDALPGFTYLWEKTDDLQNSELNNAKIFVKPAVTTIYQLSVTNNSTGCSTLDNITVTVDNVAYPTDAGADFEISCSENIGGKVIGPLTPHMSATYSWFPTEGLSDATIANPIANPKQTTTYTLTSTQDLSGCSSSDQITVTVKETFTPLLTIGDINCNGDGTYSAKIYTNGTLKLSSGSISSNRITANIGENVIVTATAIDSCGEITGVLFSPDCLPVPPTCNLSLDINAGQAICKQDGTYSIAINYTAGASISTNISSAIINGNIISNIPVGDDIEITATLNGCVEKLLFEGPISCLPTPPDCTQPLASFSAGICLGKTYNIYFTNVDGAVITAVASNSQTLAVDMVNKVISNIPMGLSVTITANLSGGCKEQILTIDSPNDSKPFLIAETGFCVGDGFYTVNFYSNGIVTANAGTITGNTARVPIGTKLVLSATEENGCASNTTEIPSPHCVVPPSTICNALELSAGQPFCEGTNTYNVAFNYTAGAIISISTGTRVGNTIINIPVGVDLVIKADWQGCEKTIIIKSTNCPPPTVDPPCNLPAATFSAGICKGNTYDIFYSKNSTATLSVNAGTILSDRIADIPMGTNVTITTNLPNGCQPQIITINSPTSTPPLLTALTECNGDGTYSIIFATNGTVSASAGTVVGNRINVAIGTSVTLVATNFQGCATSEINITSPTDCLTCYAPKLSAGQATCDEATLNTYKVALSFTQGASITVSSGTLVGNTVSGVAFGTDLIVTAQKDGCSTTITIASPEKSCATTECDKTAFSVSAGICYGLFYDVHFTKREASTTITVSAGTLDIANNVVRNIPVGTTLTISGTSLTGCGTQTISIASPGCPSISINKYAKMDDDIKKDGFAQVGEQITFNFLIKNTGNVPLSNIEIEDLLPGIEITKTINPFNLQPGEENNTAYFATYKIKQSDIDNGFLINTVSVKGTYVNQVVTAEDDVRVPITESKNCDVNIFNAVTPNGDGKNDFFKIEGIECYADNNVKIFNRWGVLVYEKDAYNNTTNSFVGKSEGRVTMNKGELLPTGTYYYIIRYKDNYSDNNTLKSGYLYLSL